MGKVERSLAKSLSVAKKRFDCPKGAGNGNSGTALQAFPVIVGQEGTGRKQGFECRLSGSAQGTK